jgi:hypothetical protein
LRSLECEYGQGYLFAGALDDAGVESLISGASNTTPFAGRTPALPFIKRRPNLKPPVTDSLKRARPRN